MTKIISSAAWDSLTTSSGFGSSSPITASPTLNPALVAAPDTGDLTYYVRFTTKSSATGVFNGSTLYRLSAFSFDNQQSVNLNNPSGGAGAGKAKFDPLGLSFSNSSLNPQLLQYLGQGSTFKEVDVLAYNASGDLVQDYSFGLAAAISLTVASGSSTTTQLQYGSESIRSYSTSAGQTTLAQSAEWELTTQSGFGSSGPLDASTTLDPALVAGPETAALTYYVRFTPEPFVTGSFNGSTLYQLSNFSFQDQQTINGTGVAGVATLDPLSLSFTQASLTPQLLQYLAAGTPFKEVDVLGYSASGDLVQDDSFGLAAASSLTVASGSPTTTQLQYSSESIRSYSTSAGQTTLAQSGAWDSRSNSSGFGSTGPIDASTTLDPALVAGQETAALTYYVRFTPEPFATGSFDGSTLYQLSNFSFQDQQTYNTLGAGPGKATFDPLSLSFTQASLTPQLLQYLAGGTHFEEVDLLGYSASGDLVQDDSFGLAAAISLTVASGSPTTTQLQYGSESIQSYSTSAGQTTLAQSAAWDSLTNRAEFGDSPPIPASTTLDPALVAGPETAALTYYLRLTPEPSAPGSFDGSTLYQLSSFSFEDQQTYNSLGAGPGKATFDPLSLSFTQASLTPQLLQYLAGGTPFEEVDVLGYSASGDLVQDDSFGFAAASSLTVASGSPTTTQLQYGSESLRSYSTSAGQTTLAQSAEWDRLTNRSVFGSSGPIDASATLDPALVARPDTSGQTYYVRFTPESGATGVFDGSTLYKLSDFSFGDQQTVILSSESGGTGAGKTTFDPLSLSFDNSSLTPQLLQYFTEGTIFNEVDVLAYGDAGNLVQEDSFGMAAATSLTVASGSPTTTQLQYGSESIQSYVTSPDGRTTTPGSEFGDPQPIPASTELDSALVAAPDTSAQDYYVRFTSKSGVGGVFGGSELYQLSGFSFENGQKISQTDTVVKATFDPLTLSFTQASLTPQLLQYLAQGTTFKEVDVLGYSASGDLVQAYNFGVVAASQLAANDTSDKSVSLEYGSEELTTYSTQDTNCFCSGVLILTDHGEAPVEALRIGDLLQTVDGLLKPVVWIGRTTVSTRFANPLRCFPIRIKAGALSESVPTRDLMVSPDHALLIDDILIQAGALVNGASIVREIPVAETFVYYHVELAEHALILAENAPAETFVDNVDRMGFDNWAEHEALFPDGKPIAEMPYPRAKARRQVPARIRAALDLRVEKIGVASQAAA